MQEACLEDLSVGRMCGKSPGYATPEGGSEGVAELITLSCAYIFVSRNLRFLDRISNVFLFVCSVGFCRSDLFRFALAIGRVEM